MNLARFLIIGSAGESQSSDGGFDAEPGETLTMRLEGIPSNVVHRVHFQVHSPSVATSPQATAGAPLLTLSSGGSSGQSVQAVTPLADVTVPMPVDGVHTWAVRCTVNSGVNAQGAFDPNYVFERIIAMRSASGHRKILPAEGTQYSPAGWAQAFNELVDLAPAPGVRIISGSSHTLELSDGLQELRSTGSGTTTITIPPQSVVAWPPLTRIAFMQLGSGQLRFAAGAGVTLSVADYLLPRVRGQYLPAFLARKGVDDWVLYGALESAL